MGCSGYSEDKSVAICVQNGDEGDCVLSVLTIGAVQLLLRLKETRNYQRNSRYWPVVGAEIVRSGGWRGRGGVYTSRPLGAECEHHTMSWRSLYGYSVPDGERRVALLGSGQDG